MIHSELLNILVCPSCDATDRELRLGGGRRPELICSACEARYPVVDGIPDMVPAGPQRVKLYRTETLDNLIASTYDVAFPAMSALGWRCSPVRFVDWTNMTLGRAAGGYHLSLPVATGKHIQHSWGPHRDARVVAVDMSWKMLRRAKHNLEHNNISSMVVRADVENLPFRGGTFRSVLSINGLHAFDKRENALSELLRMVEPGGMLGGSTLIRNRERIAEWILDAYERYGISPMLRSADYVVAELEALGNVSVHFESYGAVMFYTVEPVGE